MGTKNRQHKKAKLQYNSGRYTLTIPPWFVNKVLEAEKGDVISFDHSGDKLILRREE